MESIVPVVHVVLAVSLIVLTFVAFHLPNRIEKSLNYIDWDQDHPRTRVPVTLSFDGLIVESTDFYGVVEGLKRIGFSVQEDVPHSFGKTFNLKYGHDFSMSVRLSYAATVAENSQTLLEHARLYVATYGQLYPELLDKEFLNPEIKGEAA